MLIKRIYTCLKPRNNNLRCLIIDKNIYIKSENKYQVTKVQNIWTKIKFRNYTEVVRKKALSFQVFINNIIKTLHNISRNA